MTDKKEAIMDILMNYLPKEGVSKTRDRLVELFAPSLDVKRQVDGKFTDQYFASTQGRNDIRREHIKLLLQPQSISEGDVIRGFIEDMMNIEVGENLGMGSLDYHEKCAIDGFREYVKFDFIEERYKNQPTKDSRDSVIDEVLEIIKKRKYLGAEVKSTEYNRIVKDIVWDLEQALKTKQKETE